MKARLRFATAARKPLAKHIADIAARWGMSSRRSKQLKNSLNKKPAWRQAKENTRSCGPHNLPVMFTNASTVIYYSNDFNYGSRAQSEDRAHRIGQKDNVLYIDLEARGTVDKYIIEALRAKKDVADNVVNFAKEG